MPGNALFLLLIVFISYPPARIKGAQDSAKGNHMRIPQISCEGLSNPTGIDAPAPRLSWQMESDARGE